MYGRAGSIQESVAIAHARCQPSLSASVLLVSCQVSWKRHFYRVFNKFKPFRKKCTRKFRANFTFFSLCSSSCPKCHIFFWNKKKMRKHCNNKQKHNTNEALPCEVCGKVFRSQLLLKLHHQNVHVPQDRQFECYLCRKPLSKLTVCKAHMKRFHFDGKWYRTHS